MKTMNLHEVRKLKDGDLIEFAVPLFSFTIGKKYKVKEADIGFYITDDVGMGRPVTSTIHLENHFRKVKPAEKLSPS